MIKLEISSSSQALKDLYSKALLSRGLAYAPYSQFKVGAAIRISTGEIFSGCNVENASYGATLCAERVAIHKAISEKGLITITDIVVVTDSTPPWPPCGLCRQVISEFVTGPRSLENEISGGSRRDGEVGVYTCNLEGHYYHYLFQDLLPHAFTPDFLAPN